MIRGKDRNCYLCFWRQKEISPRRRLMCGKKGTEVEAYEWCGEFKPREISPCGTALTWGER